jgi:hypothetical protein
MSRVGDVDKSLVLADVLTADGEWHERQGDYDVAERCFVKALTVLTEALLRQPFGVSKDHVERIEALKGKIEQYDVPIDARLRLFRYHERAGKYADAEDDLFDLLDAAPSDESLIEAGMDFYERLLQFKDHELILGGLSRSEVEEALAELESRTA